MLVIAQRTKDTGKEVGGLLTGCVSRSMIEIISAHPPGPKAEFAKDRFRPDLESDIATAEKVRADSDGQIIACGSFHTHPGGSEISTLDQTAMKTWRSIFQTEQFAGLILVPNRTSSFDVVPFIIRSNFDGSEDVTEPAWVDIVT